MEIILLPEDDETMLYMAKTGRADLHNHTTASDGLLSPTELIRYAAQKGLAAAAITDHDTTDGIEEGMAAGKAFNIEVIPGVELNTRLGSEEVHILGYYIDWKHPHFQEVLLEMRDTRKTRTEKMVLKLSELYGFDISYEEVLAQAGDGAVTRPHIARVLAAKGYVRDTEEAFDKYIGTHCPAYADRYHLTPKEGIDLIESVGGVAVLAHPGLLKDQGLVNEVLKQGIKGIEVFHSKHSLEQEQYYMSLARENGLLITGGSDSHGELAAGMPIIGDVTIALNELEVLRGAAKSRNE